MDRLLFVLAVGVWIVAGSPRASALLESTPTARDGLWVAVYLVFLACLALALTRRDRRRARVYTVAQSACALALLPLGMPHFEGALLAVVGAQTLLVAPWSAALAWVVAQGVALFITILPSHELLGASKATGEYLAFSCFAMTAFALRDRERRGRIALQRMQAELLGTRSLLRDTVTMAEQSRIRRELHDSLGHHLASASAYLDAARASGDRAQLEQARSALDELVSESRAVIQGFRPGIDLREALSALKGAIPGLRLELDLERLGEVGPDRAWALFRAVQEALTNAHRHAGATTVRVRAEPTGDRVEVHIDNDGAPARFEREGVGLSSMRSRVQEAGGELDVDPGPPFTLTIGFPLAVTPP